MPFIGRQPWNFHIFIRFFFFLFFFQLLVTCEAVNNCSGSGRCVRVNTCDCNSGFKGSPDCSEGWLSCELCCWSRSKLNWFNYNALNTRNAGDVCFRSLPPWPWQRLQRYPLVTLRRYRWSFWGVSHLRVLSGYEGNFNCSVFCLRYYICIL